MLELWQKNNDSKYHAYLINKFKPILNHASWPNNHEALHNKLWRFFPIHTPPISAAPNENMACLLALQACVITQHNNQFMRGVTLTSW